jgi:hypothetical protein
VVAFGEGRELRNRLASGLKSTLGVHAERLIEFGVPPQPRNPRRNRPTKAERARRATEDGGTAADEPSPTESRSVVN